jgi:hypothetical protein
LEHDFFLFFKKVYIKYRDVCMWRKIPVGELETYSSPKVREEGEEKDGHPHAQV